MGLDYSYHVAFAIKVSQDALDNTDNARKFAELLNDYQVPRVGDVQNIDLDSIEYFDDIRDLYDIPVMGDLMGGDEVYITLPGLSSSLDRDNAGDSLELHPLMESVAEEQKVLLAKIADLLGSESPSWKLIATVY